MNQSQKTISAGFAKRDITPKKSIETVGFGRPDEHSRGVFSPLYTEAAVFRSQDEICALITIDHIGFLKANADNLREKIGALLGTDKEKVMLCFSHTHSAPNDSLSPEWLKEVCDKTEECVKEALLKLMPCDGAILNGYADIGLNRRKGAAALDRRVGVIKLCKVGHSEPSLLILRLTAHANCLKGDNYLISSDYFGAVRDKLSEEFNCPVMLTQGASGNVAPRFYNSKLDVPDACDERFVRTENALDKTADDVLRSIKDAVKNAKPQSLTCLSMYSKFITLYADVPTKERALEIADEAKRFCGIDPTGWLGEVKRLNEAGITEQADKTEVQYFALGDAALCGVSNEIMCEFAIKSAKKLCDEYFYFGGYTNGCTGYFPTEEEFDLGGFEVYWSMLIYYIYHGRVFPLRRDSATALIDFAVKNAPKKISNTALEK